MKLCNKRDFLIWTKITSILILTLFMFIAGGCGDDDENGPEPPEITGLNPNSGLVGATIQITGFNFGTDAAMTRVTFGTTSANINSITATLINVTVPDGLSAGNVTVSVTVDGQTSNEEQFTVTEIPVPTIDSIEPSEGLPGTSITITGANFSDEDSENTVSIAGENAIVTSASTTEIVAVVPDSLRTGNVQVSVTVNERTSNLGTFTVLAPEITSISPGRGTIGTAIRIEGMNFSEEPNGNIVIFGDVRADITSQSATAIETTVPPGIPASILSVRVVVNGTASNALQFDVEGPSITSISPAFGPVGSEVTITGVNFSGQISNISVNFGDASADILDATTTSLTVEVPGLPLGTANITVTVNGLIAAGTATTFEVIIPRPPLYWIERDSTTANGRLFRVVRRDGGAMTTIREDNLIVTLAVDSEADEPYWTEDEGSSFTGLTSTVRNTNGEIFTTSSNVSISSMDIDTQNDRIYWLQFDNSTGGAIWSVESSDFQGNNRNSLFVGQNFQGLSALELDVNNNYIYFVENFSDGPINDNSRVYRGNIDGTTGSLDILYEEINDLTPTSDVTGFVDLAVSGSSIYIAGTAPSGFTSQILTGNVDETTAPLSVVYESTPGSTDNPMPRVLGLTIDEEFNYLYWINFGESGGIISTDGSIFRGPLNGSLAPERIEESLLLPSISTIPVNNGRSSQSRLHNISLGFTF